MSTLYSEALLAHANAPAHATLPEDPTATATLTNPLCGDQIEVGLRIVAGRIEAIGFSANACAVCVASASLMTQELHGAEVGAFTTALERLDRAASGEPTPGSRLDIFAVLTDFPSRRPCAELPWRAIERALHAPLAPRPSPRPSGHPLADLSPWRTLKTIAERGERAVIATLVMIEGSSPCPLGSRMIVSEAGDFWGSVSGGCVESSVVRAALALLEHGLPGESQLLTFSISQGSDQGPEAEAGLVCGGSIGVHIAAAPGAEELDAYLVAEAEGESVRLVPLAGGSARLHARSSLEARSDALSQIALRTLDRGPTGFEDAGESWFVEPLLPPPRLILVGATHIAQVLARLAPEFGLSPVVVDPRAALASEGRFPRTPRIVDRPALALPALLRPRTAVVVLSHDRKIDDPALVAALASDAYYVGALGSRKTHRLRLERLREQGLERAALERIRGPVGLAIGAQGASEIALSILAQMVATRNRAPIDAGPVGALILAAGSSTRAGPINKLLHPFEGQPMIRRVVRTVLDAGTAPCIVVLGHQADRVREALRGLPVAFIINDAYAEGMGTSIACGVETLAAAGVDATAIVLGDMPRLRAEDLRRLCAAHRKDRQRRIVAPIAGEGDARRLGNPVIWPQRHFDALMALRGPQGAKSILKSAGEELLSVEIEHYGVLFDVDTIDEACRPTPSDAPPSASSQAE